MRVHDTRDIQEALAQQFRAEVQEQQENFNRCSQELWEAAEHAHLRQQELRAQQLPLGCRPHTEFNAHFSPGNMSVIYLECEALHFESEKPSSSTHNKKFWLCRLKGKAVLPDTKNPPDHMLHLLRHVNKAPFQERICQYNAAFAFTSVDESVTQPSGPKSTVHFTIGPEH